MRSKCVNIYDPQSPIYELTDTYDGRRAVPKNFFMLLDSYQNHPEAKSLGPDGEPCGPETRGLPRDVLESNPKNCLTIPMPNANIRSLNLSTSVGIVLYEALRQTGPPSK